MLYELYTWEKLRELERECRALLPGRTAVAGDTTLPARLARAVGGLLRRLGVELESWGDPAPADPECCEACG